MVLSLLDAFRMERLLDTYLKQDRYQVQSLDHPTEADRFSDAIQNDEHYTKARSRALRWDELLADVSNGYLSSSA